MFEWLRKKKEEAPAPPPPSLHEQLERIAERAAAAQPQARGALFAGAGDLCVGAGETDAAKSYYGRAINTYLEVQAYPEAAAVCWRLIEAAPGVVRTYFTLLVLAIREGDPQEIHERVMEYVRISKQSRTQNYAIARLWLVANAVTGRKLLTSIGRGLVELGDTQGGEDLLSWAATLAEPAPGPAGSPIRPIEGARWDELAQAAIADPVAIWARHWMGMDTGGVLPSHRIRARRR